MANAALLVARLVLAFLFLASGFSALARHGRHRQATFPLSVFRPPLSSPGRPASSNLPPAALIVVGYQTRAAALLLAAFSVAAGFIGHYGQGSEDPMLAFMHSQALMKDVAIAGGFLALAVAGPGAWSVDAGRRRPQA